MQLKEIESILDRVSPFENQSSWDNSGIIVGNRDSEIKKIYLALDVTFELIEQVDRDSLIITHHPLIFKPLKSLNFQKYPANILEVLIKKSISNIAMHTNFDLSHLNSYVLENVLGFKDFQKEDFLLYFNPKCTLQSLIELLKKRVGIDGLTLSGSLEDSIKRCAFCTGSGGSFIQDCNCDVLITGDIKYHDAMIAKSMGITVVDIGHFGSERFFGEALKDALIDSELNAIISQPLNPFYKS